MTYSIHCFVMNGAVRKFDKVLNLCAFSVSINFQSAQALR